ncbi:MAG: DUF2505 family protein [bacterium]
MNFKTVREYNFPVDKTVKIFFDSDESYDMNELANVTAWKVIDEKDYGDRRVGTKEWCAHSQIPPVLQHVINPRMLTWLEHSEWNRVTNVYTFTIVPHFLKKQVSCKGKTSYFEKSPDKCGRTFEIMLKVDIPIFGPIFENFILGALKQNEEQDFILSVKSLEKVYNKK